MLKTYILGPEDESEYEKFNRITPNTLFWTSLNYRNFLKKILPESETDYLIVKENNKIVGALPTFLHDGKYGIVINSLPFFGSNGGIIVDQKHPQVNVIKHLLLNAMHKLASERKAVTTTIITNPFIPDDIKFLDTYANNTLIDERIGQIKELPEKDIKKELIEIALMSSLHQKTRNMVRKGKKFNFKVIKSNNPKDFETLFELHKSNLQAIGGHFKTLSTFEAIRTTFVPESDYELYQALDGKKIAAALLLLYYKDIVEYYTPAINNEYRSQQALSFLVFEAMVDASFRGYKYWNWGGTWTSQKGVYNFKSKWGTNDMVYRYYIREYTENGTFRNYKRDKLLLNYPNYYLIPFMD